MNRSGLHAGFTMSVLLGAVAFTGACGSARITAPIGGGGGGGGGGTANVTVNLSQTHQTMAGWEATLSLGWQFGQAGLAALADSTAKDLGVNRIVLEANAGDIETSSPTAGGPCINDDNNPYHINPAGFQWTEFDERMTDFVLPLRTNIQAAGLPFYFILNYTAGGSSCAFQQTDPREYAEFVEAVLQHVKTTYNLEPDYWDLRNEPDNGQVQLTAPELTQMLDSAVARIRPLGFNHIMFLLPSTMNPNNSPTLSSAILAAASPAALASIGQITYHRYAPANAGTLAQISNLAAGHGIPVGMNGHNATDQHELYQDLTQANATSWQKFALAGPSSGNTTSGNQYYFADTRADTIAMRPATFVLRQYFRYVPPGSVRLGATASLSQVEPTAYRRPDGRVVVVANVTGATTLVIGGLPADTYHVSYATATAIGPVGTAVTISAGETVSASIPTTGVITVSP
jgi:hypothetical protein